MVCKIAFCSKFPDILDSTGRKTTRRRTQATAKGYAFHANAKRTRLAIAKRYAFHANAISKVCYEETQKNGNKYVAFVPRNSCSNIFVIFRF